MHFYFIKTPKFIHSLYKKYTWNINTDKKEIYLTFDDGPTPLVTEFVLDTLKKHKAKATFFCIGKNIEKHPELFKRIINEGHIVGNHTQNHENGWKTNNTNYLKSIDNCKSSITGLQTINNKQQTTIFRPPYGKIKRLQAKNLISKGYKIIMWSVLSGDFDKGITKERCLKNVVNNTTKGDIIVFHDSKKAYKKLEYTLPKVLDFFNKKGFEFTKL